MFEKGLDCFYIHYKGGVNSNNGWKKTNAAQKVKGDNISLHSETGEEK